MSTNGIYQLYPSLKDRPVCGPYGWIQLKNIELCADIHCSCCEATMHVDGYGISTQHIKCPYCGQVYEIGGFVKLYPLDFEPEWTMTLDKDKYYNETGN